MMNDGSNTFLQYREAGKYVPVLENTRYAGKGIVETDNLFVADDKGTDGKTDANAAMVFATASDHEDQK
jgi:hypothetical protein